MSDKIVYIGACLKVTEWDNETGLEEFYNINGSMMKPKDNVYYLAPNRKDIERYGYDDDSFGGEVSLIITSDTITNWLENFQKDFSERITQVREKFPEVEVVVAFVTGYN